MSACPILQRNLDDYSRVGDPTLDNFAPGWRDAIDYQAGDWPRCARR